MELWHGSNKKFDKFKLEVARIKNDLWGGGIFMTDNLEIAKGFSKGMAAKYGGEKYIYRVLFTPHKTFDADHTFTGNELTKFIDDPEQFARGAGLLKFGSDKYITLGKLKEGDFELTGEQVFRGLSQGMVNTAKARDKLVSLGYDSVRYNGGGLVQSHTKHNVYNAYDDSIVKVMKVYKIAPKPLKESVVRVHGNNVIKNPSTEQVLNFIEKARRGGGVRFIRNDAEGLWYMWDDADGMVHLDVIGYFMPEKGFEDLYNGGSRSLAHRYKGWSFPFTVEVDGYDLAFVTYEDEDKSKREFLRALKDPKFERMIRALQKAHRITADGQPVKNITEDLSVGRELMPQIDDPEDFLEYLTRMKISWKQETIPVVDLKSTQGEFNQEKINTLKINGVKSNLFFVSNEGYLLDGHHRWIAQMETDPTSTIEIVRIKLGILDILNRIIGEYGLTSRKSINS